VRAVAEVRFPAVLAVNSGDCLASFQQAMAERYPVVRQEFVVGGAGTAWRFADAAGNWRLSLSGVSLTLETARYSSRKDFLARFGEALHALQAHVAPGRFEYLGLRNVYCISGPALERLASLVRPEVLGVGALYAPLAGTHSLTESLLSFGVEAEAPRMLTRWGLLGVGSTYVSAVLPPLEQPAWVLDLGASSQTVPDDVGEVIAMAEGFARQLYAAFRWVVTDEFLRIYGERSEFERDALGAYAVREQSVLYSACAAELVRDTPYEIGELRRLTGMTWDALARVFGVSRRAVHLWANGGRMKDANSRQLLGLLAQARAERAGNGLPPLAPRRSRAERLQTDRRPPPPTHFISVPDNLPRPAGRVIASQPVKVPGKG
jgi:uncharacterized protein (TIGR04255 family)